MQGVSSDAIELRNKGEALLIEGKLDEALAALDEAVALAPSYANAYRNRAEVLEKLERIGEAEADRQTARALAAAVESRPAGWTAEAPARVEERDVVGAGRYVLNFILAGVIGLGLTYFLRNRGWLATWISLVIFVVLIIVVVASGA
jgi:tetratricopeptide (TPR) repeat protein